MKTDIIGAVIAKNPTELSELIGRYRDYTPWIQLDVMDSRFVPNASLDFDFQLPDIKNLFEAQLMVRDPENWIKKNAEQIDCFIVHLECCKDPGSAIRTVRDMGKRAGVAINPKTPAHNVEAYLDTLDEVLVMTVEPGFYGGRFLPETLEKVERIRTLAPEIDIGVDGGITDTTIADAFNAGANRFVSGSYLLNSANIGDAVSKLRKIMEDI